jgi:hypothetical protein
MVVPGDWSIKAHPRGVKKDRELIYKGLAVFNKNQ